MWTLSLCRTRNSRKQAPEILRGGGGRGPWQGRKEAGPPGSFLLTARRVLHWLPSQGRPAQKTRPNKEPLEAESCRAGFEQGRGRLPQPTWAWPKLPGWGRPGPWPPASCLTQTGWHTSQGPHRGCQMQDRPWVLSCACLGAVGVSGPDGVQTWLLDPTLQGLLDPCAEPCKQKGAGSEEGKSWPLP